MYGVAREVSRKILAFGKSKACQSEWKRGFFNYDRIITIDSVLWMQQHVDLTGAGIQTWIQSREWTNLCNLHRFNAARTKSLGPDLSAAYVILASGGQVKFQNRSAWFEKRPDGKFDLPVASATGNRLEAIDASGTTFMHLTVDSLGNLEELRYLNLSNCVNVDDWCLDKLSLNRETLRVLDLSGCPNVSERGLTCLHRLKNLKKVILNNMPNVRQPKLTAFLLEEALPNCIVEGIDYSDVAQEPPDSNASSALISSWENFAKSHLHEISDALMNKFDENEFNKFEERLKRNLLN